MSVKSLVLALLLTSCGTVITTVSPELSSYVVEAQACVPTKNTRSIVFADLGGSAQGLCSMIMINGKASEADIYVDKMLWNNLGECGRKALIRHELLHCEQYKVDLYEATSRSDWMFYQGISEGECQVFYELNEERYCK